jgi:acyl dehydratase
MTDSALGAGTTLPELTSRPIGREQLAYMAVAMRDPNLIHLEDSVAHEAGFDAVVAHGTFASSLMVACVTRALPSHRLRSFEARLTAPVLVGQSIRVTAVVESEEGETIQVGVAARTESGVVGRGTVTMEPGSHAE